MYRTTSELKAGLQTECLESSRNLSIPGWSASLLLTKVFCLALAYHALYLHTVIGYLLFQVSKQTAA